MTRRARGILSAAVTTVLIAAAVPGTASAAVSFSDAEVASTTLSLPTSSIPTIDLAVGGDGSVGIVAYPDSAGPPTVSVRAPGGDFSTPAPLTSAVGLPDVTLDGQGNAIVVYNEAATRMVWRYRPRGGSWSPAERLNPVTSVPAVSAQPRVAFLSDGTAVAAWVSQSFIPFPSNTIDTVTRRPGGAFSSTAIPVVTEAIMGQLSLVAGPDGRAALGWLGSDGGYRQRASRRRAGAWETPSTVGAAAVSGPPWPATFSFRPDGTLDAVWFEQAAFLDPGTGAITFNSSVRGSTRGPAAAAWSAVDELDGSITATGLFLTFPDVAAGHAVWKLGAGDPVRQASPAGGGFAATSTFPTTAGAMPLVEPLAGGRRLVTWLEGATGRYAVLGTGEEARGVLPSGAAPTVMVTDTSGRHGAMAWLTTDPSGTDTHVMSLSDPAPPARETPAEPTPAPAPAPATQQASTIDQVAPMLDRLRLTRATFRVGTQPTALSAAKRKTTPTGTELSWISNEAGTIRIAVERLTRGYRSGRLCVAKRPKSARGRVARCELAQSRGTLTRPSVSGQNKLKFSGRVGRRALPAGKYRFAITAIDAAGNRSLVRRVGFTVVRR